MTPSFLISSLIYLAFVSAVFAGDAVAVGYNSDGIWTGVTYYASSKPKGGKDYKTEHEAGEEAVRDLQKRSANKAARVEILSSSDATGFVAVGRGKEKSGKELNLVGRGKSQAEADQDAFGKLTAAGAKTKPKIVYRYFSYGAD